MIVSGWAAVDESGFFVTEKGNKGSGSTTEKNMINGSSSANVESKKRPCEKCKIDRSTDRPIGLRSED